jgi:ABC-2 type transport system permease protein
LALLIAANMLTLLSKEIKSFLNSLIGYIVITVFLLTISLFLWVFPDTEFNVLENGYANLDALFTIAPWVFLFLIPAITMRSFAEESKAGTIELLMTRPLTVMEMIGAKYLAGFALVVFALIPTLVYYYAIYSLALPVGNVDTGGLWGSYLGLLFLGASFVAIGIFASTVSDNQVISFLLGMFLCFFCFMGFESLSGLEFLKGSDHFIQQLGIHAHYLSMSRGVFDTRDGVYFGSLVYLFLFLSQSIIQKRKW